MKRQAIEVYNSLRVGGSISNYMLALPLMSLGCIRSGVAQTHTAGFLRSNQGRPKSTKAARRDEWSVEIAPHDMGLGIIAPLRRAGIPHQAIFSSNDSECLTAIV